MAGEPPSEGGKAPCECNHLSLSLFLQAKKDSSLVRGSCSTFCVNARANDIRPYGFPFLNLPFALCNFQFALRALPF